MCVLLNGHIKYLLSKSIVSDKDKFYNSDSLIQVQQFCFDSFKSFEEHFRGLK